MPDPTGQTREPIGPRTTLVLVVGGPIERAGVKGLCERARLLVDDLDAHLIVCDLGRSGATAATVDVIARLKLMAKEQGRRVRFVQATPELGDLVALVGLDDVLTLDAS